METDSTDTVTFEVGEGESGSWALYGSGQASHPDCAHLSPFGLRLSPTPDRYSYESDNGEWHHLATLDTGDPGTHTITCSAGVNTRYAVGDIDVVTTADSRLGLGVVPGILLPMAGAFVSLLIVDVTLVMRVTRTSEPRRRRARSEAVDPAR